jgi:hypothetical protein
MVTALASYAPDFPPGSLCVTINEVTDQGPNVFFSVAQWRKRNWKNVEPIKKITSKRARGNGCLQVTISGGDHPYVSAKRLSSTDTFEFTLLQNTQ